MDLVLLEQVLTERGEPAYRAGQVWEWAASGVSSYDEMTTLPKKLRAELAEKVPFSTLEAVTEREARDGTVKTLFETSDGHPVEGVLMRYRDGRRSVCLSAQSGCPLTCTFCATGQMRFRRNLTASEILDQALHFLRHERSPRRDDPSGLRGGARQRGEGEPRSTVHGVRTSGEPEASRRERRQPVAEGGSAARERQVAGGLTHAVYMGMGEPFLNVEHVLVSARRLPALGITHRRTTISTVGWMPGLRRFVDEVEEPIRLALSLHAADPVLRSELMPVNHRYPLPEVLAECRRYVALRRRKVFVDYVLLAGVNDSPAQARELAALLDARSFKVNLIPYNPISSAGGRYDGSPRERIEAFKNVLERARIPATVRLTRGRDIEAACGQLAAGAT